MKGSRKDAVRKIMGMFGCSRAVAESYVRDKLAAIECELRAGSRPIEFGRILKRAPQADKRFLVN